MKVTYTIVSDTVTPDLKARLARVQNPEPELRRMGQALPGLRGAEGVGGGLGEPRSVADVAWDVLVTFLANSSGRALHAAKLPCAPVRPIYGLFRGCEAGRMGDVS